MDDEKYQKVIIDVKKITTPETLKRSLINASLILTAYELMKYSLIDGVKDFFKTDKESYSEHENEIEQIRKRLPKKDRAILLLVYACWFKEHEALTEKDFKNIDKIRIYRNEVAHELIKFLVYSDYEVDVKYLFQIRDILEKVDVWWVKEVEALINSDIDLDKIQDASIMSGGMIILDHLISIALELDQVLKELKAD